MTQMRRTQNRKKKPGSSMAAGLLVFLLCFCAINAFARRADAAENDPAANPAQAAVTDQDSEDPGSMKKDAQVEGPSDLQEDREDAETSEDGEDSDEEESSDEEDLSDDEELPSVSEVNVPAKEFFFRVSPDDPGVLSLAKEQTPRKGKLVHEKGKTFWRLKKGKRLRNSWVWYRGYAYCLNAKGYALTGMHTYKGFLYYFDSYGRLAVKKFFSYRKKQYYACKTGALVTGAWCKVRHYIRYFRSNGAMAVNARIQGFKVNAQGKLDYDNGEKPVKTGKFRASGKKQRLIIVGASRVVQMSRAVTSDKNVIYIARSGRGYLWLKNQAIPALNRTLKRYPKSKVVIQLGNNDLTKKTPDGRIEEYIVTYRRLMDRWPKAKFYFMDILPYGDGKDEKRVEEAKAFNSMLSLVFPSGYIGGWNYMMTNGFQCSYNQTHYSDNTSREIFNFILRKIR